MGSRLALPLGVACVFAIAALTFVPRGFEANSLLQAQDDPIKLTDRALARTFDANVARREIEAALAAGDADLASSFLDLARDQAIPIEPALVEKVELANSAAAAATRAIQSFGHGFLTGEPDDLVGLAGTALGDLFVFGDIRDAVREGARLATGQQADELILGLACVGLVVTAGTYASLGVGAPARVGLSLVKAAKRTGRIGAEMATWIGRSLREIVDMGTLRRAISGVSLAEPAIAVRAAREAVKVEKARGLFRMLGDVGRVQSKAGTKAALDGLKIAQGPADMAKVAKLADAKGSRTRAIIKLLGRGAIALTIGAFNLAWWVIWAALMVFGFVSSLKRTVERMTERSIRRRKLRQARRREAIARAERLAALAASGDAPSILPDELPRPPNPPRVDAPSIFASSLPGVSPRTGGPASQGEHADDRGGRKRPVLVAVR
jgi:hypothetical protein